MSNRDRGAAERCRGSAGAMRVGISAGCVIVLLSVVVWPVPAGPPPIASSTSSSADTGTVLNARQVRELAVILERVARQVSGMLFEPKTEKELIAGVVEQWYAVTGQQMPPAVRQRLVRLADTPAERVHFLIETRQRLGDHPHLSGPYSLLLGLRGLSEATHGHCSVTWETPGLTRPLGTEMDFGVGLELEGVQGLHWLAWQWVQALSGQPTENWGGYIGSVVSFDRLSGPAHFPWRIRRVIPGSPAHQAGLLPGDWISHLSGTAITPENALQLFRQWAFPALELDPLTGQPRQPQCTLTVKRGNKRFDVRLQPGPYPQECIFGVQRLRDGSWDWWLDRPARIGYVRLGPLEQHASAQMRAALTELLQQECRGLILDLRWCPGGYVQSALEIVSLFLPADTLVARVVSRQQPAQELRTLPLQAGQRLPALLILIGPETLGGGEVIAAALRDHRRGLLAGQRSAGRAAVQSAVRLELAQFQLRVSTGLMLRPNGRPRHRFPDSQPTDEWGLRPDPGWEIPLTTTARTELKRQLELFTLRLPAQTAATPLDDPRYDAVRYAALQLFREHLARSQPLP
ncbi:MAG: S41 family peptidase [Gemmataceae bacterium]|nr:S41 family peptidase [Gemmataceae bacterium]